MEYIFGLYGTIFLMILTAYFCTYAVYTMKYCYWNVRILNKLYIRRPIYRMFFQMTVITFAPKNRNDKC